MQVRRIVANIATQDIAAARRFYHDVLGLDVVRDQGWVATYGSQDRMTVQVVALARKLLIALWRYVIAGEVPAGARLRPEV